ncbi:hypothetical protein [Prosthecobacter vanneervenii]|uniref:Uncharacterized protein n=1 Tax=Prosthecobacter vanneervenii TaxID=48466 RepID=A0A7W7YGC6_9BACT|nr:hypothetical protein [Prosthecobacter vanneervenii]MBB5035686.1 hypothetical protein [Prosthecobacter vanneervenii]
MNEAEIDSSAPPTSSWRVKVYVVANLCFAALIFYCLLYFYVPALDLPDSTYTKEAFEQNTGISASKVHDLHASISSHFNGDFIDLFAFSYTEPDFPESLVKALSLKKLTSHASTLDAPSRWNLDVSDAEYYEDTEPDRSPVTQVWIDRQAMRCLIRLSDS